MNPIALYFNSLGWRGKSLLIVGGLGILSEVGYELFLGIRSAIRNRKARREIAEVYFMNRRTLAIASAKPETVLTEHIERLVSMIDRAKHSISVAIYTFTTEQLRDALIRAYRRGVIVRVITCNSMVYNASTKLPELLNEGIIVRYKKETTNLMHHKFCVLDGEWLCAECLVKEHIKAIGKPLKEMEYSLFDKAIQSDLAGLRRMFGVSCGRCDARKRATAKDHNESGVDPLPPGGLLIAGSSNWTLAGLSTNWESQFYMSHPVLVSAYSLEFQRLWYELDDDLQYSQATLENGIKHIYADNL
ncbi:uncharacterized protein LOC125957342 [Anopheles darlingi]|uniref:uncharacterized protein LOC125957342 n=1 Tax=Anopheles darlingi TaxID=43151 RepID=UPI0021002C4F|nr:uncharacterized protein LOC125957342 [Anopheles darlingi]XP_049545945.1 uncharacterized protein LOC125957342 [Anopheles darlingi]